MLTRAVDDGKRVPSRPPEHRPEPAQRLPLDDVHPLPADSDLRRHLGRHVPDHRVVRAEATEADAA